MAGRSPSSVQIDRLCTKQRHDTNEDARAQLAKLLEIGARLDNLNLYQCVLCGGAWHVGHKAREGDP